LALNPAESLPPRVRHARAQEAPARFSDVSGGVGSPCLCKAGGRVPAANPVPPAHFAAPALPLPLGPAAGQAEALAIPHCLLQEKPRGTACKVALWKKALSATVLGVPLLFGARYLTAEPQERRRMRLMVDGVGRFSRSLRVGLQISLDYWWCTNVVLRGVMSACHQRAADALVAGAISNGGLYDLKGTLAQELDFENEGRNAERCARELQHFRYVVVPRVHWDVSSKIAEKLIKAFAEQIFYTGFVHSDPHPGNDYFLFSEVLMQRPVRLRQLAVRGWSRLAGATCQNVYGASLLRHIRVIWESLKFEVALR
ncbi:hypothetical protein E2I00_012108, partial [Balaenoptera physalus]